MNRESEDAFIRRAKNGDPLALRDLVRRESPKVSRGVNSLEIYFDGARYWIASVMWQSEDAEHPIPASLLPPGPAIAK